MDKLMIDLETFSDVDIKKAGAYRYVGSPAFEILLFGASIDDGPVEQFDLASGESIPDAILDALTDPYVKKHSYNAAFERICLSKYLRQIGYLDDEYLDPISWYCDMVLAAYNGLPISLESCGAALGLPEQKLKEGRELIRYFCVPCKATKANGGRTRNLPEHAPEKWELFKKYNRRDVEVEMQIHRRLANYPVPDTVWDEYHQDQEINDRGIMIDRQLVEQAVHIDALSKEEITKRMTALTGLENPNSVVQLQGWLREQGFPMETLGKKEVAAAISGAPAQVAEVLSLRLKLAKSSIKKYQAMENAVCSDGRCHGMFQFYGANRTGRFSSKIVQLQNLARNDMPDLAEARALVRQGDYEIVRLLYGNVPQVLSELVRTAFIPAPGYKFVVADFSAIEARVLSYLAGETWRNEVFRTGGDIYCMSASQMFGVPVEKHGINGHLRQKGKISELACIAEGSPVLTDRGLVPIENVTTEMKVWDGEAWVRHDGVVYRGEREVITYEGLTATPDHLVWTEGKPWPVYFGVAAASGAHLVQTGDGGRAVRLGENHIFGEEMEQELEPLLCTDGVPGMRKYTMAAFGQFAIRQIKRMSELLSAKADTIMAGQEVDCCKTEMREPERSGLPQLWRKRDQVSFFKRYRSWAISDRAIWASGQKHGDRPHRYERGLCPGESALCGTQSELHQSAEVCTGRVHAEVLALFRKCCHTEAVIRANPGSDYSERGDFGIREKEELEDHKRTARLYDIRNAGRHHRFTVSGHLVHNCGYGGSVGALRAMGALEMGLSEEELQPLVDAWRSANPNIVQYWWKVDKAVKLAVRQHIASSVGDVKFYYKAGMLFITLPSGRRLSYVKPQMGMNRFGGESITYMGTDSTKKWSRIESYGPKFVENIVQAISRDILCYAMHSLRDCRIVGHVHDEVIIECPMDASVEGICEIMGQTPPWMPGLLLNADGYECSFYMKS